MMLTNNGNDANADADADVTTTTVASSSKAGAEPTPSATTTTTTTTTPTTDDIDAVVNRLVDDALPLLEKRAVTASTELGRTRTELQDVQGEVKSLHDQLHQLKQDKHDAESDAIAAKQRTQVVRKDFFAAIEEQLTTVKGELETKQGVGGQQRCEDDEEERGGERTWE